jgi:hypothetical protein
VPELSAAAGDDRVFCRGSLLRDAVVVGVGGVGVELGGLAEALADAAQALAAVVGELGDERRHRLHVVGVVHR